MENTVGVLVNRSDKGYRLIRVDDVFNNLKINLNIDNWAWLRRWGEGSGLEMSGPMKGGKDQRDAFKIMRPNKFIEREALKKP